MNKFSLFLFIVCALAFGAKAQDGTSATVLIGDLYYALNETNLTAETAALPVEGENHPRYTFASITIPATVDHGGKTYSVVKIGNGSLRELPNLTSITIPVSVDTIGNSALAQCPNLISVIGSENVSVIEDWAFYGCSKLAFFMFSSHITAITEHCFQNCISLNALAIPESVTEIRTCAFQGCEKLATVNIPAGVTKIGGYAFYETAIQTVTIPGGVKNISSETFRYCGSLKSVTFLEGVESLGAWTFSDCTALEQLRLPASLTYMEDWVFDNVTTLKEIYVAWPTAPDPNDPEAAIKDVKWWTFGNKVERSACVVKVPEQYRSAYSETWFDFPIQTYTTTDITPIAAEQIRAYYADGALNLFSLDGYTVNIVSANGQRAAAFKASQTSVPLPLAPGVYILKATKGQDVATTKFIVR
jgi:hypothetical protein